VKIIEKPFLLNLSDNHTKTSSIQYRIFPE
jgi:hypothetical protein